MSTAAGAPPGALAGAIGRAAATGVSARMAAVAAGNKAPDNLDIALKGSPRDE
jgi:hypothetical protein